MLERYYLLLLISNQIMVCTVMIRRFVAPHVPRTKLFAVQLVIVLILTSSVCLLTVLFALFER